MNVQEFSSLEIGDTFLDKSQMETLKRVSERFLNKEISKSKNRARSRIEMIAPAFEEDAGGLANISNDIITEEKHALVYNVIRLYEVGFGKRKSLTPLEPQMESLEVDPLSKGEGANYYENTNKEGKENDAKQTTTFIDDAIVSVRKPVAFRSLPSLFETSSDQQNSMDIKTFVAKARLIQSGTFQHSDTFATFSPLQNPICLTNDTQVRNKLSGYFGIRATLCLKLVVNANPFQRGRYMVCYVPSGGCMMTSRWSDIHFAMHVNTNYERSQTRIMEVDLACDTSAEARIPYNSALNFFPLRTTNHLTQVGCTGQFQIFPYVSLDSTTGGATAAYNLYAWLEDVELIGAAVPQMGISATEKEAKAADQGPVSSTVFKFSKLAKEVAKIPLIGNFASDLGWALDIAGATAKAAGFSKPANVGPTNRVTISTAMYAGNVEGFDQGIMAAASCENQISVVPGIGSTNIDEMAIAYITSIPAYGGMFTWGDSVANPTGSTLMTLGVAPSLYSQSRSFSSRSVLNTTPLAFATRFFTKWRGSLIFNFKMVKNIFHSGRIAVCFFPAENGTAGGVTSPSYALSDYVHRQIIDIRECNEFKIEVPYVASSPYLPVSVLTGHLIMYVVDPLIAPSSVTSNIDIIYEVSGGSDFELAIPSDSNNVRSGTGTMFVGASPQMDAGDEEDPCRIVSNSIGTTSVNLSGTINAEICIGEKITNFRSLLKICRIQRMSTNLAVGRMESIYPFGINIRYYNTTPTNTSGYTAGDLFDLLAPCYTYNRGSMRIKRQIYDPALVLSYVSTIEVNENAPSSYWNRGTTSVLAGTYDTSMLSSGKQVIHNGCQSNGFIEFTVPHYLGRHSRVNSSDMLSSQVGYAGQHYGNLGAGVCANTMCGFKPGDYAAAPISLGTPVYRGVGDDFTMSGWISTVPTWFGTEPTTYL